MVNHFNKPASLFVLLCIFIPVLARADVTQLRKDLVCSFNDNLDEDAKNAVLAYFDRHRNELENEVRLMSEEFSIYTQDCKLQLCLKNETQEKVSWIICLRLGYTGQGNVPIDRVVLIDKAGQTMFAWPETQMADRGVLFQIRDGLIGCAFAVDRGKPFYQTGVHIWELGDEPRLLLDDYPKDSIGWASKYYFTDIDGDGTTEILVNRRIYLEDGEMTSVVGLLYTIPKDKDKKIVIDNFGIENLLKLLDKVPHSVPTLLQHAPPQANENDSVSQNTERDIRRLSSS